MGQRGDCRRAGIICVDDKAILLRILIHSLVSEFNHRPSTLVQNAGQIPERGITGTIPTEVGLLKKLSYLYAHTQPCCMYHFQNFSENPELSPPHQRLKSSP
eukprot:2267895-Pyramimonas_sp.AAC.1